MTPAASADDHPFNQQPHRTLIALSIPVTLSLIAEPITGLVDTVFVSQLGAVPLAALGVGTTALGTIFWIFNFLGISTQTEVGRALGRRDTHRASEITSLGLILGVVFSGLLVVVCLPGAASISALLGAAGEVQDYAVTYLQIRILGAPAVLLTLIGFGALRGLQDMRTPLYVAVSVNALNILLDGPFIFGLGPIPAMGVAGAAIASVISQWIGALWMLWVLRRALGFVLHTHWPDVRALLRVGGALFVRTGLLTVFLMLSTRVANQIGPEAGAAHQAVRMVWIFLALTMEGFAMTAQSLVSYFLGAERVRQARYAAALAVWWSVGTGFVLLVLMLLGTNLVIAALLPAEAVAVFGAAWVIAALTQPLSGLAFVTDGIHWGTGDYAYLRNAMLIATLCGGIVLLLIDPNMPDAFAWVWIAAVVWLAVRAVLGIVRVWPGLGYSPLRLTTA
jgi:multidrug resistance protein, MATE family